MGQSEYEAVLAWLSRQSGLPASNSSLGVTGGVGAEQGSSDI